jgi:two-component system sensor histidine kinase/response regulator
MLTNQRNKRYNILIVDDVPDNIKIAANILQRNEYKLFFATSGSGALDKVKSNKFDLILLDVIMPEMDGFEVCKQIRDDPATKDVPIIFLTAKTDTGSIIKGFDVGAVDYVTKPFNGAELLARVKTHLALRRTQEELQEANVMKDKFFSIIAHDLRNPFTSLLGMSEFIEECIDHSSKEEIKRFIKTLRTSAKIIYALLENLLTWSGLQRSIIEHSPKTIFLNEITDHTVYLFQSGAEQKQITLRNRIQENTTVYADHKMVETIIRNLISNALKFTDTGGTIDVSAVPHNDFVEIAISDTGIGMSEEVISTLFRIDVKYSKTGTAGEKGTGLGLILCKELIEKNGGTIWVESEVGKGTTFRFTLPKKSLN